MTPERLETEPVVWSHEEIAFLMRSVTRALEKTTEAESEMSRRVYDKLSDQFVRTMPPEQLRAVARALDGFNGDWSR